MAQGDVQRKAQAKEVVLPATTMANPEHVRVVRAGVAELNAWRESHPDAMLDLSGADLRRVDLAAEALPGPEIITEQRSDGTIVGRLNHRPANLESAVLKGADLRGADLTDAMLSNADLSDASMRGVCLACAVAQQARFVGADLSWSDLGWSFFAGSDLSGAQIGRTDLTGADFSNAVFRNAELGEAHINEVRLRGASSDGAFFSRTVLSGTDLATAEWAGSQHHGRCYIDTATLYRTAATLTQNGARRRDVEEFLRRSELESEVLEVFRASIGSSGKSPDTRG
jgi:uncharacterized protein YjbI with pentapeptide repeats